MCFKPCNVAMAFSSLRATSVSICAGAAPGSDAVTLIVGRSMSGKFCTFIALKDMMPPKQSSTNSMTAGMGLRIDQEETLSMAGASSSAAAAEAGGARGASRRSGRIGNANQVTIVQETRAGCHDARIGGKPVDDLDAVAHHAAGLHLHLAHAVVGVHAVHVAEAVAHDHCGLRQA